MKPSSRSTNELFSEVGLLIKSRMLEAMPLPLSQCQTLGFIAEHKNPNMQDVAHYFKIRAPSATFLVDELARGGYIARKSVARDRRRVELLLTPKGKRCYKTIWDKRQKILGNLFNPLAEQDRQDLNRILQKVLDSD